MPTPDEILMGLEIVASLDEDAWERLEEAKDAVRESGFDGSFAVAVIRYLEGQEWQG